MKTGLDIPEIGWDILMGVSGGIRMVTSTVHFQVLSVRVEFHIWEQMQEIE